jgi:hypothetical protein
VVQQKREENAKQRTKAEDKAAKAAKRAEQKAKDEADAAAAKEAKAAAKAAEAAAEEAAAAKASELLKGGKKGEELAAAAKAMGPDKAPTPKALAAAVLASFKEGSPESTGVQWVAPEEFGAALKVCAGMGPQAVQAQAGVLYACQVHN